MAKKKKKEPEERVVDGNVVLFTALSMILLAFFIVLNSIAVIDQNKKLEAWGSLLGSFGILPGGVLLNEGDTLLPYESPILEQGEMYQDTKRVMERYIVEYQLTKDVGFTYEGKNLTISIKNEFLFLPGKAELNRKNLPFLNLVTRLIASVDNKVRLEGYVGEREAGKGPLNIWDLALLRGIKTMEYMVEKGQVAPMRFSIGGYGNRKGFAARDKKSAKNSGRIDITLLGEVRVGNKDDDGLYRYKGFIFDFGEGMSGGR